MKLQHFFHTRYVTQLGLFIGKHLPRRVAVWLAMLIGRWLAWRKPALYRTVSGNLGHVLASELKAGLDVNEETLRQTTRRLFTNAGQTYYDFYRALNSPRETIADAVHLPPFFLDYLQQAETRDEGVLIMAMHMSNFDLAALALGANGFVCQALSVSNPPGGFSLVNRLRAKGGHDITPLSPAALRKALRRLNEGGIVAIGMDYPTPTEPERPKLFGAPSYFPAGPARFALLSEATVFVVACHYDQTEGYKLYVTGPVEMEKTEDRKKSAEVNTRRLARIAEDYIRRCPEQWMMFYPFWPDVADGKKAEEAPP